MALPGLPSQEASRRDRSAPNMRWPVHFRSGFSKAVQRFNAGWSSPVARQAHNLKVIGSNPIPATKYEAPAILIDCRGFLLSLRSCPPPQVRSGLLSRSQRSDRRTGIQSSAPSRSQFQSRPPIDVEEENPKRTGYVRSLRRFAGCHANKLLDHSQARRADGYRAIRPEGAKQQGGFVRCVSASRPGGVRLQLHATSRLRPSELFPVPALLRCHCIRNSIVYEVRAGRKK